jgi:hypothetical protein
VGLVRVTINTVDRYNEDFIVVLKILPNNLVEKIHVRNKKVKKCENECYKGGKKVNSHLPFVP